MNPADYAIRNKLISWIIILTSIIGGIFAYQQMPRFEDPEFLIRTAQIVTEYPGATPQEVADEVSDTLETEIQGMQEVDEIRSTSYFGYSVISVDIKQKFSPKRQDLQQVWTRLRNKVTDAERSLPPGANSPIVNDDFGDVFGLYYLVTGEDFSLKELENYARDLRKDLLTVDGVAKVATMGEQQEVIRVEVSRDRAAALGVSVNEVFSDLAQQNSVVAAGNVKIGDQRLIIHPTGALDSVESIKAVTISLGDDNKLLTLGDVATVTRDIAEPAFLLARYDGKPAIAVGISNVTGANVAEIGDAIRAKLSSTLSLRPNGIEVNEFYHQGDAVNSAVKSFALNVLAALGIVLVTLLVFMGVRSAVVIGAVLVITIGATLATMQLIGIPMHRISLGALIIALGMLVDNAIVVTEGVLIGTQAGKSVLASARDIVGRTKWALLGGTIVGILAFAPIGFAPGTTAEYTNHLFWVIFISLVYSWVFAISLAPMLADLMFTSKGNLQQKTKPESVMMQSYKRILTTIVRFRWATIGFVVLLFSASVIGLGQVKEGFFPASPTPQIAIDYWLPEGTDIQATSRDVSVIEAELNSYEGIEGLHSVIGAGALRYMLIYSPETPNSAYAQLILKIDNIDRINALIPRIQSYLDASFPAAQARVWRFQLGPSQGSKIEAAFTGPDPKVLRKLATNATDIMIRDAGATAVKNDWREEVPVIKPDYDPARGGRSGISREDVANALNTNFTGRTIGVYREGDDLLPIITRAPEAERSDLATASGILIPSRRTGQTTPLSEALKDLRVEWTDSQMLREDRVWTLKVQADPVSGISTSELFNRLRPQVESIDLPPGYNLRWDGEFGDSQEANAELAQTLPLGLLAMILVVVLLFNAIRQAVVIWLIVPLAIIGVVVGLLVTGTALEFMALLGLLSLSGLLIKNAIVLVDQMGSEIEDGKPRFEAIIDSAASRVRPVLMGSLTTVLGVIPLMWDVFFASMAVVIVFGLTFATLLTLLVLPAIYSVIFKIKPHEVSATAIESQKDAQTS